MQTSHPPIRSQLSPIAVLIALAFSTALFAQDKPALDKAASDRPSTTAERPVTADKAAPDKAPGAAIATTAPAADGLKIVDTKVGSGKEAQSGTAAMVHYTGWLYDEKAPDKKGKQFDASANRGGLPFGFIVGVGRVIKGWDQGVVGMKVGGKRTLIVPPALAYGDKEVGGGTIPANSTLVFDIELVEVKP